MTTTELVRLCAAYAAGRGIALSTVGRLAAGHGGFFGRLHAGRVTVRRMDRVVQWLSDHWPADLPWPADVPRPVPAVRPEAPAVPPAAAPSVPPRAAVAAVRERMRAAIGVGDWESAGRHEQAMLAAALTLDGRGQIADPNALCLALGAPRYVYDDVVRRYAGHPERRPRPTTRTGRMVQALRLSGDRRFAGPSPPREAA